MLHIFRFRICLFLQVVLPLAEQENAGVPRHHLFADMALTLHLGGRVGLRVRLLGLVWNGR